MRKLMILSGSRYIVPLIAKTHELGIYVITADYLPDNVAHYFSDQYNAGSCVWLYLRCRYNRINS